MAFSIAGHWTGITVKGGVQTSRPGRRGGEPVGPGCPRKVYCGAERERERERKATPMRSVKGSLRQLGRTRGVNRRKKGVT